MRQTHPEASFPAWAHLSGELVGREDEMQRLQAYLRDPAIRLVTLTGPGGAGKTSLAAWVSRRMEGDFSAGVIFVDLAPLEDVETIPLAIAAALKLPDLGDQPPLAHLVDTLRSQEMLLFLDNFEHLTEGAGVVVGLLGECPRLKVLTTSREALRVRGERELPVPPLNLPDLQDLPPLANLGQVPAIDLFLQRVAAILPDFSLDEQNAPAVAEICARLDGLPLAIELAAGRVRLLTPPAMLAQMREHAFSPEQAALPLLRDGARDLPDRQRTLQDAVAWSYALLGEQEGQIFRRLAVFSGGFSLPAANAVLQMPASALLDAIACLLEESLLYRQEIPGEVEPRYRMLMTIREFALQKLRQCGEESAYREAHATYFYHFSESAREGLKGPRQSEWISRLEAEIDNLRSAMNWSIQAQAVSASAFQAGLGIAGNLEYFWYLRGHLFEGRTWLARLLEQAERLPVETDRAYRAALARAYMAAGTLAWAQGDLELSQRWNQTGLVLFQDLRDIQGMARVYDNLGCLASEKGDSQTGLDCFRSSLEFYAREGDPWGEATLANNLGAIMESLGDYPAAQEYYQVFVRLAEQIQDPFLLTLAYHNFGALNRRRGDLVAARQFYEKALERGNQTRHVLLLMSSYHDLALLAHQQGDLSEALGLHWSSLHLAQKYGVKTVQVDGLEALAEIAVDLQQDTLAARLLGAVQRARQEADLPRLEVTESIYRACQQALQARLGESAYTRHYLDGRSLELSEAIHLALSSLTVAVQPTQRDTPGQVLTRRELEIAGLIAQGKSNEEIAAELFVVVKTVEKHISSILRKLGFRSRAEIAVWEVQRRG